jgi:hypothetical protein
MNETGGFEDEHEDEDEEDAAVLRLLTSSPTRGAADSPCSN